MEYKPLPMLENVKNTILCSFEKVKKLIKDPDLS